MADENPSKEVDGESTMQSRTPSLPHNVSKAKKSTTSGRKRSWVWDHFTEIINENPDVKRRASCNYCHHTYACDPKQNGTTSLSNHLENQCLIYSLKKGDKGQTTLGFTPEKRQNRLGLVPIKEGDNADRDSDSFSPEKCCEVLAEMLIIDELPFSFVEGEGFRRFIYFFQPKWTNIPNSVTIARECYKVYLREKKKLKNALIGQRVCLTMNTWTSLETLNYMCLTAHFIDSDWKLQKRILNFCLVENHKGSTLGMAIEKCLLDWKLDKILTLTVDDDSSNDLIVDFLKRKTKHRKETILQHEFLHMRCCAYVFNLIVKEGLKDMADSIAKVRNVVRYTMSSLERVETFKLCAKLERLSYKNEVILDVPTVWSSTYKMLDRAEKYEKAFERLVEDDENFLNAIREWDDDDTSRTVRSRPLGPPTGEDWDKCRVFVKFLKLCYDATLRSLGSNHVTCNASFMELLAIQDVIESKCKEGNLLVHSMAEDMKLRLGNFTDMSPLLYVALVLDPRFKMRYIEFCFGMASELTRKVKDALTSLYETYVAKGEGSEQHLKESRSSSTRCERKDMMSQFRKYLKGEESIENKTELERYLLDRCVEDEDGFDVLTWWKLHSSEYPVLSLVARHVLAIPLSSVASEFAFSLEGHVLDSFRSSLSPNMLEALICAQSWLRASIPASFGDATDDDEELYKLGSELMDEANSLEMEPTMMEDMEED